MHERIAALIATVVLVTCSYGHCVTIKIEADMEDRYALQNAIAAAAQGDTISLAPGWYPGGWTVDKAIVLIGSGIVSTTVATMMGGPVFTITADGVVIKSMTMVGVVTDTHLKWGLLGPDLLIENASPRIERTYIANGGYAVLVRGESNPVFRFNILGGAQATTLRLENVSNDIDARWNMWGGGWQWWPEFDTSSGVFASTSEEIEKRVWDRNDEIDLGRVMFEPWVTSVDPILTGVRSVSWGMIKQTTAHRD